MPRILPVYADVTWPENEGVIGVVGVAPWATLDFCRKVYLHVEAEKDWHFPRILVDANTKLPSRGRYLQMGERDPSPFIAETIEELARQGATVAVVPCNTAHILYSRWANSASIPVINIVEATLSQLVDNTQHTIAVLGSQSLLESGLYQSYISSSNNLFLPLRESEQALVNELIAYLKCNEYASDLLLSSLGNLIERLRVRGADTLFLACTELGAIRSADFGSKVNVIDSNDALAMAALKSI